MIFVSRLVTAVMMAGGTKLDVAGGNKLDVPSRWLCSVMR